MANNNSIYIIPVLSSNAGDLIQRQLNQIKDLSISIDTISLSPTAIHSLTMQLSKMVSEGTSNKSNLAFSKPQSPNTKQNSSLASAFYKSQKNSSKADQVSFPIKGTTQKGSNAASLNTSNSKLTLKQTAGEADKAFTLIDSLKESLMSTFTDKLSNMVFSLAINGLSQLITSLYKTKEELFSIAEESKLHYEESKSYLNDLNAELNTNNAKIANIQGNGNLSYTDQAEIKKIQEANDELKKQIFLKEEILKKDREKAAKDAYNASVKGNDYFYSEDDRENFAGKIKFDGANVENGEMNIDQTSSDNAGLSSLMASYDVLQTKLGTLKEGTKDWLDIINKINNITQIVTGRLGEMSDLLSAIKPEYENILDKQKNHEFLSKDDINIKNKYEDLHSSYDDILKSVFPEQWNSAQFDHIFNNSDVELTKDRLLSMQKSGTLDDLDLSQYINLADAIQNANFAFGEGEDAIASFKNQLATIADMESYDPYEFANKSAVEETISSYDSLSNTLTNLADLQEALGDSFTLSAEEARHFADIFPEILSMGQVTGDGLLQLNEDQANAFITGKQEMANMDTEQRIQELENAKNTLVGVKIKAETELEIAQQVANGEMTMEEGAALATSETKKNLTQYLIDLGMDEAAAQKAVAEVNAGNISEFGEVVAGVSQKNNDNLTNSADSSAIGIKDNSENMAASLDGIGNTAANVAGQIANLSSGQVSYTGKAAIIGGAAGTGKFKASTYLGHFKGMDPTTITAQYKNPEDWISKLEFDISKYTSAISSIDAQINLLKSANTGKLSNFSSGKYTPSNTGSTNQGSSSNGYTAPKEEKQYSKTFDWITNAISQLENKIKQLGNTVSNVYKSWSDRNSALNKEITSLVDELQLQTAVYGTYMDQADSIGLSDYYKNLVQNGSLSIEDINNESLSKQIEEYQKYYDSAQQASEKIQTLEKDLSDAFSTKFDNITKEYEDQLSTIEFKTLQLNKLMEMSKNQGFTTSAKFYSYLVDQTLENINFLEREKNSLQNAVNEAVENKTMEIGSEKWYELTQKILDVETAITDANASLIDFGNSMRDIEWDLFDHLQDTISQVTTESHFLLGLLENKQLVSNNGDLTNEGTAALGLHGVNYNTYMQQSDEYAKSIKDLDHQYQNDSLNNDYLKRRQELVELQQKSIQNAEDEKQAMVDLAKQGYETMIDSLKELIDQRKEWLQTEKDLYNYQKEIARQTNEVSQIEKQLGAYGNDDSEESKKTVQELKDQLQQAKDNLEDTEYDRYISDQEALLDKLYEEAELWLNERFDNIDQWFGELIDQVNANSGIIGSTLTETTNNLGYTLSSAMQTIFGSNTDKMIGSSNGIQNAIVKYGDQFGSHLTTLQTAINSIKANIQAMVDKANIEAEKAKQEAEKKAQEANRPSSGSGTANSGGSNSSAGNSGSNTGSNNTNASLKSIFVSKKDSYPKNQLNRYTSIVDALKYYDFDSSFARCEEYYRKLGGGGTYIGSYAQNTWMLSKFRGIMGYSKGGIVGELQSIAKGNGDDMITVNTLKRGEGIIPLELMPSMHSLINGLPTLNKAIQIIQGNGYRAFGELNHLYLDNLSVTLPNITNYKEFRNAMLNDSSLMNTIKSEIGTELGFGAKLNKNRYKL